MGEKSNKSKDSGTDTDLEDGEEEEEFFTVDKILDRKTEDGQVKYLIHWLGYDESYDTWEPLESLDTCLKTVKAFDKKFNAKNEADKKIKRKRKSGGKAQPMAVIGATDEYPNKEGLHFLVKLSNGGTDLIPRDEMHRLYHQILIDFYESNAKWQVASK